MSNLDLNNNNKATLFGEKSLKRILLTNASRKIEWLRSHKSSAASSHPFSALIRALKVTKDSPDNYLKKQSNTTGMSASNVLLFSNKNNKGREIKDLLFHGMQTVVAVPGNMNDDPIKILMHNNKDLSMPLLSGGTISKGTPVIRVSILAVASTYRDYLASSSLTEIAPSIPVFVMTVLLPKIIDSYTDISIFNIFTGHSNDDIVLSESVDSLSFLMLNEKPFIERAKVDFDQRFLNKGPRISYAVNSIPTKRSINEIFNVDEIPGSFQAEWIGLYVYALSSLKIIESMGVGSSYLNRGMIYTILKDISIFLISKRFPETRISEINKITQKLKDLL